MGDNNTQLGFRVLLTVFKDEDLLQKCYIYIDFEKMKTVLDVEIHIKKLLGLKFFSLYIKEAWLPKHESALVITNKDILVAKLDDNGPVRPKQSPVKVNSKDTVNCNIASQKKEDIVKASQKITHKSNNSDLNTKKNKPSNILQNNDLDYGKIKLPNLDPEKTLSLLQQLEMKTCQLLKQKYDPPKERNESNNQHLTETKLKALKTKLNDMISNESNTAIPTHNDSPTVKKKRIRRHKKNKTTLDSAATNNNPPVSNQPKTNIKPLGLGKHIRFSNENEGCSGDCTVEINGDKEYLVQKNIESNDSETYNKNVVIVSKDKDITDEITPVEVSKQIPNFENMTKVSTQIFQSTEDIDTSEKVYSSVDEMSVVADENKDTTTILDGTQDVIVETTSDENKFSMDTIENEVAVDVTIEDGNQECNKTDENNMEDSSMKEVDEATNESIGNELATDIPMETLQDQFYDGDENHYDDWKARLLKLANEKQITSKIFNRKSATTV